MISQMLPVACPPCSPAGLLWWCQYSWFLLVTIKRQRWWKRYLWWIVQSEWDLPKSLVITFRGTWGSTSLTCLAIFESLWSSVARLWTLNPMPWTPGFLTSGARQTKQALNRCRIRQLNNMRVHLHTCSCLWNTVSLPLNVLCFVSFSHLGGDQAQFHR